MLLKNFGTLMLEASASLLPFADSTDASNAPLPFLPGSSVYATQDFVHPSLRITSLERAYSMSKNICFAS
jgi:hypothetical protein